MRVDLEVGVDQLGRVIVRDTYIGNHYTFTVKEARELADLLRKKVLEAEEVVRKTWE